jgi:Eukaryotic translation initiation factor 3 subunit 7 (eIF-3)
MEGLAFPPKADQLLTIPLTTAPGVTSFENMFYDPPSPIASRDDLPVYPPKKRRSASPEPSPETIHGHRRAGTVSIFDGSSPVADSSPSTLKLERLTNCTRSPMLNGLGVPSNNPCKHLRKPNHSAMVPPSDAAQFMQPPIASQDEVLLIGQSNGRKGWRDWEKVSMAHVTFQMRCSFPSKNNRTHESSVAIDPSWQMLEEIEFHCLAKLRLEVDEPEELQKTSETLQSVADLYDDHICGTCLMSL